MYLFVRRGPEVDELDGVVGATDAVDTTKALDDAHRVPVDVVVDEIVAVLQVLAFGNAVGGDEEVYFAILRHGLHLAPLFGAWSEVGEDVGEVSLAEGAAVGACAARHQGDVNAQRVA